MGDILDELMGIYQTLLEDDVKPLNDSSINLEEIMFNPDNKIIDPYVSDNAAGIQALTELVKNNFKSTVNKLYEEIDFLKNELTEKNLFIRALIFQNADDNKNKVDIGLLQTPMSFQENITSSENSCILPSHVCNSSTEMSDTAENSFPLFENTVATNNERGYEPLETQLRNYKKKQKDNYTAGRSYQYDVEEEINTDDMLFNSTPMNDSDKEYHDTHSSFSSSSSKNEIPWLKYSTGFAKKILTKMGYEEGRGLGKSGNGITEPIKIDNPIKDISAAGRRKLMFILSDSMLNKMDVERLSNKNFEVRRFSHGGCKINCMFSHLPKIFEAKPDFVLLHVGTNDLMSKTSDIVIKELQRLKNYIQKALPSCVIYFSLPTLRTDNNRANIITGNLNCKLKRANYLLMDNSNIEVDHLGKKGLHLNHHGTKIMAKNIISLLKRI